MKSNPAKVFSATLLALVLISTVPAQSAVKKPASKAKTCPVCPSPLTKTPVKPAVKKTTAAKVSPKVSTKLPRLVDLGATKCIPCKMMTPILQDLAKNYKGKLNVEFIDVWENRSAGAKYKINSIPTQIFYDANGKEFYRHVGFFPKEDILAKFKEHKIDLGKVK